MKGYKLQGHTVSPHKVWRDPFLKAFHSKWGNFIFGKFTGRMLYMED